MDQTYEQLAELCRATGRIEGLGIDARLVTDDHDHDHDGKDSATAED